MFAEPEIGLCFSLVNNIPGMAINEFAVDVIPVFAGLE
jgi:hypothetical protein